MTFHNSPQDPSIAEHNTLEELNDGLPTQTRSTTITPWWLSVVANNRAFFHRVALFDEDADSDRIFLFLLAKQTNQRAWFLECIEQHRIVGEGFELGSLNKVFVFLGPLRLLRDVDLNLQEDTNIGIYYDLRFEGETLSSYHDAMRFEDFVMQFPPSSLSQPAQRERKRKRDDSAMAEWLEMYPWLSSEDFDEKIKRSATRKSGGKRPRDDASSRHSDESDESDGVDVAVASGDERDDVDVAVALGAKRAELLDAERDDVDDDLYFHTVVRGGAWTLRETGAVADSVRGQARSQLVRTWCERFHFKKTRTFSFTRYGEVGASALAKEFCRKGNYFVGLYMMSMDPAFVYRAVDIASYTEHPEFALYVNGLEAGDPVLDAATEIAALAPV